MPYVLLHNVPKDFTHTHTQTQIHTYTEKESLTSDLGFGENWINCEISVSRENVNILHSYIRGGIWCKPNVFFLLLILGNSVPNNRIALLLCPIISSVPSLSRQVKWV